MNLKYPANYTECKTSFYFCSFIQKFSTISMELKGVKGCVSLSSTSGVLNALQLVLTARILYIIYIFVIVRDWISPLVYMSY